MITPYRNLTFRRMLKRVEDFLLEDVDSSVYDPPVKLIKKHRLSDTDEKTNDDEDTYEYIYWK